MSFQLKKAKKKT